MNAPAQSSATIVAAYLDAIIRKDASAVDRYFHPDVEYMVNGTRSPDPAGVLPPISAECHSALPWLAKGWCKTHVLNLAYGGPEFSWKVLG